MHYRYLYRIFSISIIFFFVVSFASGQKIELKANAYGGLFFFRGDGSSDVSTVYHSDLGLYFARPYYGRKSDISYAFELQVQPVTRQNHLYGVGFGIEKLTSSAEIDSIYGDIPNALPATGTVNFENTVFAISPYLGQRLVAKKFSFELTAGIDVAISTNVKVIGNISSPYTDRFEIPQSRPTDIRPRFQFNMYYQMVGLSAGYSLGTKDFYTYDNKKAHARLIRLGISYRIISKEKKRPYQFK
jgi:hypothetical protein